MQGERKFLKRPSVPIFYGPMPQKRPPRTTHTKAGATGSSTHTQTVSPKAPTSSFRLALLAVIVAIGAASCLRLLSSQRTRLAEHVEVDLLIPEPADVQLVADVPKREAVKDAMRYAWGEYGKSKLIIS